MVRSSVPAYRIPAQARPRTATAAAAAAAKPKGWSPSTKNEPSGPPPSKHEADSASFGNNAAVPVERSEWQSTTPPSDHPDAVPVWLRVDALWPKHAQSSQQQQQQKQRSAGTPTARQQPVGRTLSNISTASSSHSPLAAGSSVVLARSMLRRTPPNRTHSNESFASVDTVSSAGTIATTATTATTDGGNAENASVHNKPPYEWKRGWMVPVKPSNTAQSSPAAAVGTHQADSAANTRTHTTNEHLNTPNKVECSNHEKTSNNKAAAQANNDEEYEVDLQHEEIDPDEDAQSPRSSATATSDQVVIWTVDDQISQAYHNSKPNDDDGTETSTPSRQRQQQRPGKITVSKSMHYEKNIYRINSSQQTPPDDLVTVQHFSEPTIVDSLRLRFMNGKMYTSTGPVLIALNPFEDLTDQLYTNECMAQYWERSESAASSGSNGKNKNDNRRTSVPVSDQDETDDRDESPSLPPHVFSIADDAFRSMMRGVEANLVKSKYSAESNAEHRKYDQSILVSGESGAGKTVTTKFVLKYLATLSQRTADQAQGKQKRAYQTTKRHATEAGDKNSAALNGGTPSIVPDSGAENDSGNATSSPQTQPLQQCPSIESQVLQSNPILESFGNARTVRNDNSSRFGKYIELQFTSGRLIGTKIETYLLEKVRVVQQNPGERNYHIFYELLSSRDNDMKRQFHLQPNDTPYEFRLLCGGIASNSPAPGRNIPPDVTLDRRDGVLDRDTFRSLKEAMTTMNFSTQERNDVFRTTCAILHASNLQFDAKTDGEDSKLSKSGDTRHLRATYDLLGVTEAMLEQALCTCSIVVAGSHIQRPLNVDKAYKGLQAFLKAIYGALFAKLVHKINSSIAYDRDGSAGDSDGGFATIGILDIFGFETFPVNRFEQLCINYTNEALQQQFNSFMLSYSQGGGIDMNEHNITFPDNQNVLDLLDSKQNNGLFVVLDDVCKTPHATDANYARQVYKYHSGNNEKFHASRRQRSNEMFTIHHYAGKVEYTIQGFIEKNLDNMPKETIDLLHSSSNPFVRDLVNYLGIPSGANGDAASSPSKTSQQQQPVKLTVSGFFCQQLRNLRTQKLQTTQPHYVRCIKPNDELRPKLYDPAMVVQQLRCGGILQAITITKNGFSFTYTFDEFVKRYGMLWKAPPSTRKDPAKQRCQALIDHLLTTKFRTSKSSDLIQISDGGKVMMKHLAFQRLELLASQYRSVAATKINAVHRRFLCRVAYLSVRQSFYEELRQQNMTFDEWFQEYRAIYYQTGRRKNAKINIPSSIVSQRKAAIQKKLGKTNESKFRSMTFALENSAWTLNDDGLWKHR